MKPPFSYYGGKQRIARHIVKLIPRHTVYVEPCCGGATIMFTKPWPQVSIPHYNREVINDLNGDLVNFFKQLRDNGEELCRQLYFSLYSEEDHRLSKNRDIEDDLERARRFFISASQSFSGTLDAGWKRCVFNKNHPLSDIKHKVDRLSEYIERMRGSYICNTTALKVIDQFDSPQTFFYLDPPYVDCDQVGYAKQGHGGDYGKEDHLELIEKLNNIKGSFILSGYDTGLEPDDWELFKVKARTSSANQKTKKNRDTVECIWRKLSTERPKENIEKRMFGSEFDCFTGDLYEPGVNGEIVEK